MGWPRQADAGGAFFRVQRGLPRNWRRLSGVVNAYSTPARARHSSFTGSRLRAGIEYP
ncbi:protein of unknown function [Burkholderia multivorans]